MNRTNGGQVRSAIDVWSTTTMIGNGITQLGPDKCQCRRSHGEKNQISSPRKARPQLWRYL